MHKQTLKPQTLRDRWIERFRAVSFACLATLLSLPANAGIAIPDDPLTTGSRVPPNILFILDDSGSMAWRYMYNPSIPRISGGGISSAATGNNTGSDNSYNTTSTNINAIYDQSYVTNTIYYNPITDYVPWTGADGTPRAGGTSYAAAYSSPNYADGSTTPGGTTDLSDDVQTFYVPKAGNSDTTDATQYYRYQILTNGRVVRSERLQASLSSNEGLLRTGLSGGKNSYTATFFLDVPATATNVTFSTQANNGNANLYVRFNNATVNINNFDWSATSNNSNESISINNPTAGRYYVVVRGPNSNGIAFNNLTLRGTHSALDNTGETAAGCDTTTTGWGWRNCTYATPTGRGEAAEKVNFATWYSYNRTRTKTAKSGSSAAFSGMGNDVRVGFRTIHNRNNFNIPVNSNQGLFADISASGVTNRSTWYQRLFDAQATSGTPLHGALASAGAYYANSTNAGPYGPEVGTSQLSCRQNFAILTTDGYWNSVSTSAGNEDGTSAAAITGPGGKSYTYTASAPYQDTVSNTLADIAMYYWKTDLRTDLANTVPESTANPAFWQHMVTFGISIGLKGNTGMSSVGSVPSSYAAWPDPTDNEDADRIDDLLHAAVNGRGTFLAASDPDEFTNGLKAALAAITERTGSFSNVSANSTRIDTETKVFQATYVSGVWTGEFSAYTENATTKKFDVLAWKASEHIPSTGRKILTHTGAIAATFPTAGQVTALDRNGTSDQYKVTGANNAAYIAGNRTLELRNPGGTLRNRNSVLGDVVSSSPAYTSDTDTLYVGANDGMLHAIDADDGAELFAYMPAGINLADLSTISRPDYSHRYFVDGPMVVSTRAQTPGNKNILVGALGKGGKGVFALDVTNPGSFTAANVKWDKSGNNLLTANGYVQDADMGLVQGAPIIAKLNNNATVAIVSNGVNSSNNHAVLFIYNLDTGALVSKIDTGVGTSAVPNGLSAPVAWDDDGDGRVDHVYAGDLYGNLWKFDLSSSTPSTWQAPTSRKKLFTAQYPGSPATLQPITSGPTVALDPKTYKTWVFFGTGSFMTTGDVSNQNVQSLYGVIDNDSTTLRTELTSRRTVLAGTRDGMPVRSFEANTPLPAGSKGWFINLLTPPSDTVEGERIVSDPQMYGSALVVASIIPVADACQSDGKGYVNAMDAFTGTSLGTSFFDLPGDDTLTDRSGNKLPIGSVDLGVGMGTMPNLMRGRLTQGGSTGGKKDVKITDPRNTGRVSWREVIRD